MKLDLSTRTEQVICRGNTGGYRLCRIPGIVCHHGSVFLTWEARADSGNDWGTIDVKVARRMPDGTVEEVLTIGASHLPKDGKLYTYNNPTLISDDKRLHLIYHLNYERVFIVTTRDLGQTWTEPREITEGYRQPEYDWNVCATGPGHGIRMTSGRLIAPVWWADGESFAGGIRSHHPSRAGCVYSDDHGQTWNPGHLTMGLTDASETAVVEFAHEWLLFNYRNEDPDRRRALGISVNGGETLSQCWKAKDLIDPVCFGGMTAWGDTILCSNCNTDAGRTNLTVKESVDGGRNWEVIWDVDPLSGYPDIACDGERVYVFYERFGQGVEDLVLQSVKIVK